jgi:hypothetical protein
MDGDEYQYYSTNKQGGVGARNLWLDEVRKVELAGQM